MKLFYRKYGQGPAVVILHGVFGFSDNWVSIAKKLEKEFTVYLPDLRNHGQSPHSDEFSYDFIVKDIKELLDDLSLRKVIMIGHSMGGKAAMRFVSEYPDRVQKLVVVDIAPRYYKTNHQTIIAGLKSLDLKNMQKRTEADKQISSYVESKGVRQFLLKNLYRKEDGSFALRINLDVIDKKIESVGAALEIPYPITIPALFIKGEYSEYITIEDEIEISRIFINSRFVTIKNAGHWVHADQSQSFLNELSDFLK